MRCDSSVSWSGWYRLFINNVRAHISENTKSWRQCGTDITLWLRGGHPNVSDGVVTREICSGFDFDCRWLFTVKVKACAGNYYVYELVKPSVSCSGYCADVGNVTVTSQIISPDPCNKYTVLDNPWRAVDYKYLSVTHCDNAMSGWYRFLLNGSNAQIPDTCVDRYSCSTVNGYWLRGGHPSEADGIVSRDACSKFYTDCCFYGVYPVKVKACPGGFYVYNLLNIGCDAAYCAVSSTPQVPFLATAPGPVTAGSVSEPCTSYTVLDQPWRSNPYSPSNMRCDSSVSWSGWYRLFINNVRAHISESSKSWRQCGTDITLWLRGGHPNVSDGVVTREICSGFDFDCRWLFTVKVKACAGNYYVYELVKPSVSCSGYCADVGNVTVTSQIISPDPCNKYTVLDNPWRAVDYKYLSVTHCDNAMSGWYRFLLNGSNAQIPDTCVDRYSCSTVNGYWLRGGHPSEADGIVSRDACAKFYTDCCFYGVYPVKVKACPGGFYVYNLLNIGCDAAYCAVSSTPQVPFLTTAPGPVTAGSVSEPCTSYTVLDQPWRSNPYSPSNMRCDSSVSWSGWYRLFINNVRAHISESSKSWRQCGTDITLWLRGGHPNVSDGVVTREICSGFDFDCRWLFTVKVKACAGNYYVYELVKPSVSCSGYCADVGNVLVTSQIISPDPCNKYTVLDNPWRAVDYKYLSVTHCDNAMSGWYRFLLNGSNAQIPDTCVDRYSCSTVNGYWLRGGHPSEADGIVSRDACAKFYTDCCFYGVYPVKVKACPGGFYVYNLLNIGCDAAYCA
ncbi:hypothetical protein DNTS_030184, partial [Danionella cerebrum]